MSGSIQTDSVLPVQSTYTGKGGTLLVTASGSGYRASSLAGLSGLIGMFVMVDSQQYRVEVYTNERNSHKAFISRTIPISGLPAGQHTIKLLPMFAPDCGSSSERIDTPCMATDPNDFFNVTVLELRK
jgi:hypothetical protein